MINGKTYVQFGAGLSAPDGWISYDASPTLRLLRIPFVGGLLCRLAGIETPFPKATQIGDVVKGLPVQQGSVTGAYGSHVLEHLALDDFRVALRNVHDILEPGGRLSWHFGLDTAARAGTTDFYSIALHEVGQDRKSVV